MEKYEKSKEYEPPAIKTYTEDEILDLIGPANTCGSSVMFPGHGGHGHGHGHGHRH